MALENAAEWQASLKELTEIYDEGEARQVLDDANVELLARVQTAHVALQNASAGLESAIIPRVDHVISYKECARRHRAATAHFVHSLLRS